MQGEPLLSGRSSSLTSLGRVLSTVATAGLLQINLHPSCGPELSRNDAQLEPRKFFAVFLVSLNSISSLSYNAPDLTWNEVNQRKNSDTQSDTIHLYPVGIERISFFPMQKVGPSSQEQLTPTSAVRRHCFWNHRDGENISVKAGVKTRLLEYHRVDLPCEMSWGVCDKFQISKVSSKRQQTQQYRSTVQYEHRNRCHKAVNVNYCCGEDQVSNVLSR